MIKAVPRRLLNSIWHSLDNSLLLSKDQLELYHFFAKISFINQLCYRAVNKIVSFPGLDSIIHGIYLRSIVTCHWKK